MKKNKTFNKLFLPIIAMSLILTSCWSPDSSSRSSSYSYSPRSSSPSSSQRTSSAVSSLSVDSSIESSAEESSGIDSSSGEEIIAKPRSMFDSEEINNQVTEYLSAPKMTAGDSDVYSMLVHSLGSELYEKGYQVFPGYAVIETSDDVNTLVPGLAYTIFEDYRLDGSDEETGFYSCGFYQLVFSEEDICLNEEIVKQGIVVIPESKTIDEGNYIISIQTDIKPFSGIYLDKYFTYKMVNDYVAIIDIKPNERALWDENIDLYDFDKEEYLLRNDFTYHSTSATSFYVDEYEAYCEARKLYEDIVEVQDKNHIDISNSVLFMFSEELVASYLISQQIETLNQIILEQLQGVELEEHQYIMISKNGVEIKNTQEYINAKSEERMVNGIISTITSSLMVAGAVFGAIASFGVGTSVAIPIIFTSISAIAGAYAVSNGIEAIQEIYYGHHKNIEDASLNPLLAGFKAMFGDSQATEIAYHTVGITASILSSIPTIISGVAKAAATAGKAAEVASAIGKNVALAVTKSVVASIAKVAVPVGVSVAVSKGVTYLVNEATGKEYYARLAGITSGIVAALVTSLSFNILDKKIGLHISQKDLKAYQTLKTNEAIEQSFLSGYTGDESNAVKGNAGELHSSNKLTRSGWVKKSVADPTDLNQKTPTGIDGIYKKGNKWIVVESKFGSSKLSTLKNGTKEMEQKWIASRIEKAFGGKTPDYRDFTNAFKNGDVTSVLHNSTVVNNQFVDTFYLLDTEANVVGTGESTIEALLGLIGGLGGL